MEAVKLPGISSASELPRSFLFICWDAISLFIVNVLSGACRSAGWNRSAAILRALLIAIVLASPANADEIIQQPASSGDDIRPSVADENLQQPAGPEDDIRPSVEEEKLLHPAGPKEAIGPELVSKPAVSAERRFWNGRVELKRENTNRATPEETTRTTFKIETYPSGVLSLVRLEIPFPDERTDLEGSPFHPRLGDIAFRVGIGPFPGDGKRTAAYLEATFPTADQESLGTGKYQLSAGIYMTFLLPVRDGLAGTRRLTFSPLLEQTVSVAGDPDRKDINYTKLELTLRDVMGAYWLALKVKPVVDWEQDAKTGAVAELEGGKLFGRIWSSWLMVGARLWGESLPSTYSMRITLGVARMF